MCKIIQGQVLSLKGDSFKHSNLGGVNVMNFTYNTTYAEVSERLEGAVAPLHIS